MLETLSVLKEAIVKPKTDNKIDGNKTGGDKTNGDGTDDRKTRYYRYF